ncbi:FAH family protein [Streptomyces physcomitrii]|uniref:FAH family protein n=1 Tax=Streptomyces physcomitrii TaxID=2724184 RepID=A0ABX1H885_9ACTN|nr:FAH family protein [Streptomyces physcomitrii]NKI44288.1 FAH family protein [Streptomyces physcomitrii]
MTVLFECVHQGERYFGFGIPAEGEPLRLHRLDGLDLSAALLDAAASGADPRAALTAGRPAVEVPWTESAGVEFRPPLLPDSVGDALIGGFMQTHNVKVDAATQSQPNWFFKSLGEGLRVSGSELAVPASSLAICEEAEVVLVYAVDASGEPRYLGHGFGNDLTDIGRFKRHAGHLSYAKLCEAGISPFLFLGEPPESVTGTVTIERGGQAAYQGEFTTGTKALHYGLADIMTELFSYRALHHPGRIHYVYLGADRSSFHGGHQMADGDRITLDFASHGVVLSNTVRWS